MVDFTIRVVVDPRQVQPGMRPVQRELAKSTRSANLLGTALKRALAVLGTGAALFSATRTLASFSQEMSTVRSVAQGTEEQFAALEQTAISLGTNTRFSATQAAEGMAFLSRAGFDAGQVLETIEGTLQLAQAGALGLGEAADIASNVLNAMRLEVDQTSRVVDVLAKAATSSNTTVSQLGQALSFVAPVAASLNLSIEDTTSAISALSDAGIQASRAGTGLQRVLNTLEQGTPQLEDALRGTGVTLEDVRISSVGLSSALLAIRRAGLDAGTALQVFGDRGGPAFQVLQNAGGDIAVFADELRNADGTAARIAATMDDNLNGSLLALRSAFQGLILTLGQRGAQGALRSFVDTLTGVLRTATQNVETFINSVQGLVFVLSVSFARRAIPAAIAAIRAFGLAIATNPIGALATILTGSIGLIIAFRKEIANLQVGGTRLGDVFSAVFNAISRRVGFLAVQFVEFTIPILQSLQGLARAFPVIFSLISKDVIKFVNGFSRVFLRAFGGEEGAIGVLRVFGNFAIATAVTIGDVFSGVINTLFEGFKLLGSFNPDEPIKSLARIAVRGFKRTGDEIDAVLTNARDNFGNDYVSGFLEIGKRAALKLTDGFEGRSGIDAFAAFFNIDDEILADIAARKGARAGDAFRAGLTAAIGALTGGAGIGALNDDVRRLAGLLDGAASSSKNLVDNLPDEKSIPRSVHDAIDQLTDRLGKANTAAGEVAMTLQQGLAEGLDTALKGITDVAGAANDLLANGFQKAEDALVDFIVTGKFDFKSLVDSILRDVARLFVRGALVNLLGTFFGVPTLGLASTAAPGFGSPGGRNLGDGGGGSPLGGGSLPRVGNNTPAVTTSNSTASQPEQGGVTIVNVTNPEELLAVMSSRAGDEIIMNAISRNRQEVRQVLP